jgi:hypothetical protein
MNWDSYGNYDELHDIYELASQSMLSHWLPELHRVNPDDERLRMEIQLAHGNLKGNRPLHPRRTLDQFYYSSLRNTMTRDSDQTISKWTGSDLQGDGRPRAADDSLLIMVDQLWCFVLDDSKCSSS